jgi:uncharacterized protein (DUF58 family)
VIYPTRRAVALMGVGAPFALGLAALAPSLWIAAAGWIFGVLSLIGLDAWLAPSSRGLTFDVEAPRELATVAEAEPMAVNLSFRGRGPRSVEATLKTNAKITASPARRPGEVIDQAAHLSFRLAPVRRGEGRLERIWARWTGPLGLLHLQVSSPLDQTVVVAPNVRGVRDEAMRLFTRDAAFGQKAQIERGDGTEFHALKEFQPGMDLRSIDWKQSARHGLVLSKEYKTERNHPIMMAIDSGRLMGEPIGGAPKLDRALNAALLLGYVSLRMGDRVGLCAFDSRPRLTGRPVSGATAFPLIRRLAAKVDYAAEETNFTLGLSAVSAVLDRRALVVVFTDFADMTSAQLMLEAAGRLTRRHLVLFVLPEDEPLEQLARAKPVEPADVSRAVVAAALLRERELVVARLRRLGAEVVEAPIDRIGPALLDRYISLKRRDRL